MTMRMWENSDIRIVINGLAHRDRITLPSVITASGRPSLGQSAVVPAGCFADVAMLPHIDYPDLAECRPGAGLVGSRAPSLAPYLDDAQLPSILDLKVKRFEVPIDRRQLQSWVRATSGFAASPQAFLDLSGWNLDWLVDLLDRMRTGGLEAEIIIAERRAALAVRKMWLNVVWGDAQDPDLASTCGAVAAGRALVDLCSLVHAQLRAEGGGDMRAREAFARVLETVARFQTHVAKADRSINPESARTSLKTALGFGRKLVSSIGRFSVENDAGEQRLRRWHRLGKSLGRTGANSVAGAASARLDKIDRAFDDLRCADLGSRLERTEWCLRSRQALLGLTLSARVERLARLRRIRSDLIAKLAVTRRLDRIHLLFPWMAAPHAAFAGCAGGALGAVATVLECGRVLDIARELALRVGGADPRQIQRRLTIPLAREIYGSRCLTFSHVAREGPAGFALSDGAMSHAVVQAMLAGKYFGPRHPMHEALRGSIAWSLTSSLKDRKTARTVERVELTKPIYALTSREDDLARYMGFTLLELLANSLCEIFPAGHRREGTGIHLDLATHRAFVTMLRDLENPLRTGKHDMACPSAIPGAEGELARADGLRRKPRNRRADDPDGAGQGLRKAALERLKSSAARGGVLRKLVADTRAWRVPGDKRQPLRPADELLDAVLCGRANLAQISPVADLSLPVLWFRPDIDVDRHDWLAQVASKASAATPARPRSQLAAIAIQAARVGISAPLLFDLHVRTIRTAHLTCALFTALSPVTADHALVP